MPKKKKKRIHWSQQGYELGGSKSIIWRPKLKLLEPFILDWIAYLNNKQTTLFKDNAQRAYSSPLLAFIIHIYMIT